MSDRDIKIADARVSLVKEIDGPNGRSIVSEVKLNVGPGSTPMILTLGVELPFGRTFELVLRDPQETTPPGDVTRVFRDEDQ